MTTFMLPLHQVDAARLDALVADSVEEGRQLEYKEKLPGDRDPEKLEFLKDVTSFANAAGGDILYGMKARRDAEGKPTGAPEIVGLQDLNLDAVKTRLENLLRDGVAPRLPSVEFHRIPRPTGHPCLLLRMSRSWVGLHMVIFKNEPRFYSRNSAGKFPLDVAGIREAFLAGETAHQRVRAFRAERINRISAHETPVQLGEGAKLIFHALPLVGHSEAWQRFLVLGGEGIRTSSLTPVARSLSSLDWHFNLDGFVVFNVTKDTGQAAYCQIFRDGGAETVCCGVVDRNSQYGGFFGATMERVVIQTLSRWKGLWRQIGVQGPIVLGLTLTGVKDQMILRWAPHPASGPDGTLDRDVVVVPETVAFDPFADPDVLLKPLFDYVWNGGGWEASPHYRDGRWSEKP